MASTDVAAPQAGAIAPRNSRDTAIRVAVWGAVSILAVLVILGAATTSGFLTTTNVRAILSSVAFVGMIAVATSLIMVSGNLFSLSLGATAAITAMAFLALLSHGIVLAVVVTILLGVAIGALQGIVVGSIGANPIIVTIGAVSLQQGIALWASGGATIVPPKGDTSYAWLDSHIFTVPVPVYVLFGTVIVLDQVLRRTRFGRQLMLIGENLTAARAAGMPTTLVITGAFALAGLCTAIGGLELGAFNQSGSLLVEGTLTYDAIAAAVVGGVAITGGRGSVWQALGGAITIAMISDILLLRGYSEGVQILVKGVIVLVVVILMRLNRMRVET